MEFSDAQKSTQTSFTKTVGDFRTKLEYHEYLKSQLHQLLSAKCPDFRFIKEYPPGEPRGIDIVGVKEILGKEREIMAIEVLGIAEERAKKGAPLSSGQVQKIMTDVSRLLLRSKAPVKILVFSTAEVKDYMLKVKEQNIKKGYLNWAEIEFYEINELINKF